MEEILKQILNRLNTIDQRFDKIDQRFDANDQRFDANDRQLENINQKLSNLETGQENLQTEQSEMRKEVAFYYGSMMKKLDETKLELSSEIKHISTVQEQHLNVLEVLNEKQ